MGQQIAAITPALASAAAVVLLLVHVLVINFRCTDLSVFLLP